MRSKSYVEILPVISAALLIFAGDAILEICFPRFSGWAWHTISVVGKISVVPIFIYALSCFAKKIIPDRHFLGHYS